MIDIRPVLFMLGCLLLPLGGAMLIPAMVDLAVGHPDWQTFVTSSFLTLFCGGALALGCRNTKVDFTTRQAFLFSTLSWFTIAAFGALPFILQESGPSFTDAIFESVSGITTTGSTVFNGLESLPPGILLWRSILQWFGGIGIIVFAIALLPNLQMGGMQLFRLESSDQGDKVLPRVAEISFVIAVIYICVTTLCAIAYSAAGMGPFDAVNHAMTTVSTAGYSTKDSSIGGFALPAVEWVAIIFMAVGALPFLLYFQMIRGRPLELMREPQVRAFFILIAGITLIMIAVQMARDPALAALDALRLGLFNVLAVVTGTGYASTDYGAWGGLAVAIFFFATFVGGCAGSTSCGVKIFRWQVLIATARAEIRRVMQPHQVQRVIYNGRKLDDSVIESVMVFVFVFFVTFAVITVLLALTGVDPITALSGAATSVANVGPGLGPVIGPSGNFSPLPDAAKWILVMGMILGRLEFLALLVLFRRRFWQD